MTINEMKQRMRDLVCKRKEATAGTRSSGYSRDYKKLGDFHPYIDVNGVKWELDPEDNIHLVPWSKTSNIESDIMIIAQDWASEEFIKSNEDKSHYTIGYAPKLKTNKFLEKFLGQYFHIKFDNIYRTDAFVFVKPDGMSTKIPPRDIRLSVRNYIIPLIDIMKPKSIISIGGAAYNCIRLEYNLDYLAIKCADEAVIIGDGGSRLWCVPHTGGRGVSLTKGQSAERWSMIAKDYQNR